MRLWAAAAAARNVCREESGGLCFPSLSLYHVLRVVLLCFVCLLPMLLVPASLFQPTIHKRFLYGVNTARVYDQRKIYLKMKLDYVQPFKDNSPSLSGENEMQFIGCRHHRTFTRAFIGEPNIHYYHRRRANYGILTHNHNTAIN